MRAGIGYDIHILSEGRKLFLGGVKIEHIKGAVAHSDGDVILHALCDAVLGAVGEGDIGMMYPDSDPAYKDAPGIELFKGVCNLMRGKGYGINNIDCVVILETPKLGPYKEAMRKKIADAAGISLSAVNIKAKTNEGIGSVGRNEAVAAYAVAVVEQSCPDRKGA